MKRLLHYITSSESFQINDRFHSCKTASHLEKKARTQLRGSSSKDLASSRMNCMTIAWCATWFISPCFCNERSQQFDIIIWEKSRQNCAIKGISTKRSSNCNRNARIQSNQNLPQNLKLNNAYHGKPAQNGVMLKLIKTSSISKLMHHITR